MPQKVRDGKVIGYVRVSTGEQADSGNGLDAQRAAITAECARRGWELVEIIADAGTSGSVPFADREGGAQVLAALRARQATGLIVAKLDRLSRSVPDFGGFLEIARRARWALVALDFDLDTSTPSGELVANIMISVAQWERRIIGQRTREAMAMIPREEHVGKDGELKQAPGREPSIPEAVQARVVELRRQGVSLRQIAALMNAEVPTGPRGGSWHVSTVLRVLKRHAADLPAIRPGRRARSRRPAAGRATS